MFINFQKKNNYKKITTLFVETLKYEAVIIKTNSAKKRWSHQFPRYNCIKRLILTNHRDLYLGRFRIV